MKNEKGFIKVILMLIIIALIGILVFFGYAMYSEFTGEGTIILGNLEVTFPSNENREQINNSNLKIDNTILPIKVVIDTLIHSFSIYILLSLLFYVKYYFLIINSY